MQQTKTSLDWPAESRLEWEIDGRILAGTVRCLLGNSLEEEEENVKLQFSRGKLLTVAISLSLSTLDWENQACKMEEYSPYYRKLKGNTITKLPPN